MKFETQTVYLHLSPFRHSLSWVYLRKEGRWEEKKEVDLNSLLLSIAFLRVKINHRVKGPTFPELQDLLLWLFTLPSDKSRREQSKPTAHSSSLPGDNPWPRERK